VTHVDYKVHFISTQGQNAFVGIQINDFSAAPSGGSFRNTVEQGNCQILPLAAAGSGSIARTISGKCYCWKVMGQTYAEYVSDDTNMALVTANPSDNVWMTIFVSDGGTTGGPAVHVCVELTMHGFFLGSAQTAES